MLSSKDRFLIDLLALYRRARIGDVGRDVTDKFNLTIRRIYDEFGLDLRGLLIRSDEHDIPPPGRHADEGPLRPDEMHTCLMSGRSLQIKLEEAITRLDAEIQ